MEWPSTLIPYNRTDEFDQDSIPESLLRTHSTKQGVWAMIRVLEGTLILTTGDEEEELHPKNPGFVEPQVEHHVKPEGDVRFFVEFYRDASAR